MADTKITPNNQQVRFRGQVTKEASVASGDEPNDEGNDRATQLHKKGLISEGALAKAKAKKKAMPKPAETKGGLPKSERQEDSSNERGENDPADKQIEGSGGQPGIKTSGKVDGDDEPKQKKGLALDDED